MAAGGLTIGAFAVGIGGGVAGNASPGLSVMFGGGNVVAGIGGGGAIGGAAGFVAGAPGRTKNEPSRLATEPVWAAQALLSAVVSDAAFGAGAGVAFDPDDFNVNGAGAMAVD